ncbi:MAG: RNHCP domain-containing protein [Candidatus Taylorbacteria bacterium]|nr:RNHCP domain-containing protein [Candidatus Taylorbacteria bacterium]
MKSKQFQKKVEDFVCEHCGTSVSGNGYTNHCPLCLWSKHVDVHPGDRKATCGGLMEPVSFEKVSDGYVITQVCAQCGFQRKNSFCEGDSFDTLLAIASR